MLSNERIRKIYNDFILPTHDDEYKNRFHPLPLEKNNKKWKWEEKDISRIIALLDFERLLNKYEI